MIPRSCSSTFWMSTKTGVQVAAVQLQDVDPPEAVAAVFKDVTNAKEDREKLINQAQGYRNDITPKAKGEAAQLVNQAKGICASAVESRPGETQSLPRHAKEYNQAKDIISKRIYIETLEDVLPTSTNSCSTAKAENGPCRISRWTVSASRHPAGATQERTP